jgi:hypothetical protein
VAGRGRGKREEGRGKREEGRGKREEGRATLTIDYIDLIKSIT